MGCAGGHLAIILQELLRCVVCAMGLAGGGTALVLLLLTLLRGRGFREPGLGRLEGSQFRSVGGLWDEERTRIQLLVCGCLLCYSLHTANRCCNALLSTQ